MRQVANIPGSAWYKGIGAGAFLRLPKRDSVGKEDHARRIEFAWVQDSLCWSNHHNHQCTLHAALRRVVPCKGVRFIPVPSHLRWSVGRSSRNEKATESQNQTTRRASVGTGRLTYERQALPISHDLSSLKYLDHA